MWRLAVVVVVFQLTHCQHHNHGEIVKDANNLHMHYTDDLCHEILLLNCQHGNTHDIVCGSNNVEYHGHCAFAKARCKDPKLTLLGRGHCHLLTTQGMLTSNIPETTTTTTIMGGESTIPGGVTHTPPHSVPMKSTMATVPASTVDPVFIIIHDVFCTNANQISCGATPDISICGTDGHIYRNQCMFSKVKCIKTDLEVASSPSFCATTTTL